MGSANKRLITLLAILSSLAQCCDAVQYRLGEA